MPVIVPVKAWADHRSGATVYYIDGQPIAGIGAVPLANLSNWSRGALIIGGVATWGATAHPGGAGYALTTDANDTLWDQTPAWSGRHTFSAGIELPNGQSIGIAGNELLTVNSAGYYYFSGCNVGINETTPDELLHITSSTSQKPAVLIENTNDDTFAPRLQFYKNSASPADNDDLGLTGFLGEDSGGTQTRFGYIAGSSLDITDTDEAGGIRAVVLIDGFDYELLTISGYNGNVGQGEVIINEDAQDVDTRIEAVGVADALQVRGSDGQITLGVLTAGIVVSDAGGILSVTAGTPVLGGGAGASPCVAYWSDANTLASDAGLTVDAGNNFYLVSNAGGVGNTAATARLVFDSSGATDYAYFSSCYVGISTASPVARFDVSDGNIIAIEIGADINLTSRTDATRKFGRFAGYHYTNAEEPVAIALYDSDGTNNFVKIGGGSSITNAATAIQFYTAATTTTVTGTERGRFTSAGYFLVNATTGNAQVYVDQASATGAVPVLYLDQGDVSEQHIVLSMNGADQDFPNMVQLAVTGSPAWWWDESENAFGYKNISGLLLEDADWIGNSGTTARLAFDSSAATDYAYFMGAAVGISTSAPASTNTGLDIASGGIGLVIGADNAAITRTNVTEKYARIGAYHYTNAEEPISMISGFSVAATNNVIVGGGSATMNAATDVYIYTAANTTTTTGTQRVQVDDTYVYITNLTGINIEDADWIGNGPAAARLVFDSGGTDYANFAHGLLYINETANANMTQGLTINQGANDDEILTGKSSDVAHGATSITETDTYFFVKKHDASAGGARICGMRDADGVAGFALHLQGFLAENSDTSKSVDSIAPVVIGGHITSGANITNMNADGNVAVFRTMRGGAYEAVVIIDVDGDVYYDGSLVPYDDYNDALAVQDAARVLSGNWNDTLTYNAKVLAEMGVISLNKDGTPAMVSTKRMTALMAGAIGQLYERIQALEARSEAA